MTQGFIAENNDLSFYNGKAVINLAIPVYYDDTDESAFDFYGFVSAYFRVYDERLGRIIKNFTSQVTRNSNVLVINLSVNDMTFEDVGIYYFELGYNSNGYEVPIRYGKLFIV